MRDLQTEYKGTSTRQGRRGVSKEVNITIDLQIPFEKESK
jgi:hypothetical protein